MGGSLKRVPKNRDELGDGLEPVATTHFTCYRPLDLWEDMICMSKNK